jgi:short-subunit dehydrogenase
MIYYLNNFIELLGKKIAVTGGTKGIGKAIVEELCSLDAQVITCARSEEDLNNCMQEWKKVSHCLSSITITSDLNFISGRLRGAHLFGRFKHRSRP